MIISYYNIIFTLLQCNSKDTQLIKHLQVRLDNMEEEIETFIDESDYLEVEWPEVVYKPRLDLDRFDNDAYDHVDGENRLVDNNPRRAADLSHETREQKVSRTIWSKRIFIFPGLGSRVHFDPAHSGSGS